MGRKRTAEEKRRYAQENGFNDDDTDIDDNPIPRDVLDYTKERYDVQMELWLEYKTTHSEATPHNLKTLKHFAEFMAKSIKGLLDPNGKPTVQTVRNYFRCFVSGWNIDNPKSLISRDHRDSITNYIKGPLKKKLGLSTAKRPRTYLTLENYMYMERQLWQSDGHEYVHDGYRVFISAKLKCHVFTSARVGEISEGSTRRGTGQGLRYKDTVMLVAWKDGEPELRYSLKREFAKGMHDKEQQRPTHILYEHLPDQPLIVNPMLFMLAIFLAAGAFKKYDTVEQVLAVEPPADQKYWVLEWADHVLDFPVFPEVSADGPTEKIQSASAFCTQVRELSLRAGMEQAVTVHGIRRESLIQATSNGYSKDELMKFAAHTNQMTMTRDYLSSITVVDGLGGFLKLPVRSDQAEDFRSMTVKRNPELFLSLPAKTQDELRQREDYIAVTKKLEDLSFETNAETRMAARNQLLKQKRMLEKEELNRVRSTQDRMHPSEREGKGKHHVDHDRSWFDRLRHMMPERESLSNMLFCVFPLRSPEGISAVKGLLSLLKSNCRVAYQPLLRPRQGKCPVLHCGVDLEQIHIDCRWKHVFECTMAYQKGPHKFVEFCFVCHHAVAGLNAWESHCQEHIDKHQLPLRCDFVKFRRAIVYSGRCMTCLHNKRLPAARRLYGFRKQVSWEKHINECFPTYVEKLGATKALPCPDPDCSMAYDSEQDLWYHLQDAHSYPPRGVRTKTEKERDIFVDGRLSPVKQKRRRVHVEEEIGKFDSALAESIKTECSSGPETSTDSSGTNTPQSSVFDVDYLRETYPSIASISSPSLTFIDGENLCISERTISPSLSPSGPISWDWKEGQASQANTGLSLIWHDTSQTMLEDRHEGSTFDIQHPLSRISDSAHSTDTIAAHGSQGAFPGGWASRSLRASPLSTVPMESIHPELRTDLSSAEDMEGVVTESHSVGQGGTEDRAPPKAAAIDEDNTWEVEALLAKWKQGRRVLYLVKWKDFPDEANSWEKRKDISTELVNEFDTAYSKYGGNHLGVELLNKRIHQGRVEYFVRWKGRPGSENSWERESNISHERIREFEARRRENASEL